MDRQQMRENNEFDNVYIVTWMGLVYVRKYAMWIAYDIKYEEAKVVDGCLHI